MSKIDSVGTFIGEIVESAISTSKNGFPQWTPRFLAVKKYIDNKDDMAHFQLTEPGYVEWNFSEDIVGFLVLYGQNKQDPEGEPVPTLNYEQAQLAVGWEGLDFELLNDSVGKTVLFRVQEDTYQGKTSLKVSWIDKSDASPTATLKNLDTAAIKDLNAKFLKVKPKVAAAKPASAPTKPATKPAATKSATVAPTAEKPAATAAPAVVPTSQTTTAPAASTPAPKAPSKKKTPATPPPQPAEEKVPTELPVETSQADAWTYVTTNKGGNEDNVVEEAWIAACQEVGADRDEDSFTPADWAKVRNIVIKDLGINV